MNAKLCSISTDQSGGKMRGSAENFAQILGQKTDRLDHTSTNHAAFVLFRGSFLVATKITLREA
jgi:hypothetical protein